MIPMMWFDEEIIINKSISDQLAQVSRIIQLNEVIPACLFCLGIVFIVLSVIFGLKEKTKMKDKKVNSTTCSIILIVKFISLFVD